MFQTAGYPVHAPYFGYNDYQTPPRTPQGPTDRTYYSPRTYVYSSTPTPKSHTRRATGENIKYTTYSTPRPTTTTHYTVKPEYTTSAQSTPQRRSDYVSGSHRKRDGTRYHYHEPTVGGAQRKYSNSKQYSSQRSRYVYDESGAFEYEYLPRYEQYESRPPPYKRQQSYHEARADHRYYDQVPIYTAAESTERPRQRRSSYTTTTKPQHEPPPRPRTSTSNKPPPQATAEDARRAGIPAGYSYKNWDPTEEPILLLGSVFDANSLGKWIYDWTVFYYGPATPITEMAGELWLLLIQLAGKIKRAEDTLTRIRQTASRDMVDDFLESGERLWQRFNKLLKICENYMWKAAKRECGIAKKVTMGKNSGCEFVDSMFGRDRELERTERLMTGLRLWSMRFDANCEDILRNPAA
ncbi:hypothetical protein LTR78_001974 [Recurvomyces mirabilis]|uniref:Vegetative cell wall protein gp1 n=1 Tax=Recurvomyces mirabilis TaxID=574656 RepID=A0AAE0WTI0_9PEZI|nr:hypothetical protein LTR78_001974 [Recurvomyces mirabilis]KAK5160432.1 hypothetical protein LTS14_001444 [Recurvomyces mirabilis]